MVMGCLYETRCFSYLLQEGLSSPATKEAAVGVIGKPNQHRWSNRPSRTIGRKVRVAEENEAAEY